MLMDGVWLCKCCCGLLSNSQRTCMQCAMRRYVSPRDGSADVLSKVDVTHENHPSEIWSVLPPLDKCGGMAQILADMSGFYLFYCFVLAFLSKIKQCDRLRCWPTGGKNKQCFLNHWHFLCNTSGLWPQCSTFICFSMSRWWCIMSQCNYSSCKIGLKLQSVLQVNN